MLGNYVYCANKIKRKYEIDDIILNIDIILENYGLYFMNNLLYQ